MPIQLGWTMLSESVLGIASRKISKDEYVFTLLERMMPVAGLVPEVKKLFVDGRVINAMYSAFGCHMSFLHSDCRPSHMFHVVVEVYSQSKVANATRGGGGSWRARPDTSDDANFRLVFQYDKDFAFLREGKMDYSGPQRPPGFATPQGFEVFRTLADDIAKATKAAH